MIIHVHHHIELPTGVLDQLNALTRKVDLTNQKLESLMSTIDDLVATVAAEDTVIDGSVATITGLVAAVAALKTTQTDPATAAKIDTLVADIKSKTVALAAANVSGTPAPSASAPPITPAVATSQATAAVANAGP